MAPRAFAVEAATRLASFVAGAATAVGGPAIEVALLGGGGLFAEPFGHLCARPPGPGRGVRGSRV